jgi:hypothetical protein
MNSKIYSKVKVVTVVRGQLPTPEVRVRARARASGDFGGQRGNVAVLRSPLFIFHRLFHHPSSGLGTVGHIVTEVPYGLFHPNLSN